MTYAIGQGHAGSLSHWARPSIEPATSFMVPSRICFRFATTGTPQTSLQYQVALGPCCCISPLGSKEPCPAHQLKTQVKKSKAISKHISVFSCLPQLQDNSQPDISDFQLYAQRIMRPGRWGRVPLREKLVKGTSPPGSLPFKDALCSSFYLILFVPSTPSDLIFIFCPEFIIEIKRRVSLLKATPLPEPNSLNLSEL